MYIHPLERSGLPDVRHEVHDLLAVVSLTEDTCLAF